MFSPGCSSWELSEVTIRLVWSSGIGGGVNEGDKDGEVVSGPSGISST